MAIISTVPEALKSERHRIPGTVEPGGDFEDVSSPVPSHFRQRYLSAAASLVVAGCLLGCDDGGGGKKRGVAASITSFVRGDSNNDGKVDIGDGIYTNNYLFLAGLEPVCLDAADADDSGLIDVSDPIYTWNHLFRSGPGIPEPFPDAGLDASPDELTCDSYLLSTAAKEEELDLE
jgi:hypothetical protein